MKNLTAHFVFAIVCASAFQVKAFDLGDFKKAMNQASQVAAEIQTVNCNANYFVDDSGQHKIVQIGTRKNIGEACQEAQQKRFTTYNMYTGYGETQYKLISLVCTDRLGQTSTVNGETCQVEQK